MAKTDPEFLDTDAVAAEFKAQMQRGLDVGFRDLRRQLITPFGVALKERMFYFGPVTPSERSWEIAGEWVDSDEGPIISKLELFPSRRITGPDGTIRPRPEESVPEGGLDRDIIRSLGSRPKIRKAILEAKAREAKKLEGLNRTARGKSLEWWINRADKYLTVAENVGTYGVQKRLASPSQKDDYWGVGKAGTRYRVEKLRQMELLDLSEPFPRPGRNHPRWKDEDVSDG